MLEKKEIYSKVKIIDSNEIDTIDSLIENKVNTSKNTHKQTKNNLKKIDLKKIPSEMKDYKRDLAQRDIKQKHISPKVIGEEYIQSMNEYNKYTQLLEPIEFLENIEQLVASSDLTIQKLKELQSKCSLGIVDLEHKLEFEDLDEKAGYELMLLLKKLSIYKRYIRDTLDKYNSISDILKTLDTSFTKTQIENLRRIEKVHSNRVYTPRVFNIVENKTYPAAKMSLHTLALDLEELIKSTNKQG